MALRECSECGVSFDPHSPAKRKAGGRSFIAPTAPKRYLHHTSGWSGAMESRVRSRSSSSTRRVTETSIRGGSNPFLVTIRARTVRWVMSHRRVLSLTSPQLLTMGATQTTRGKHHEELVSPRNASDASERRGGQHRPQLQDQEDGQGRGSGVTPRTSQQDRPMELKRVPVRAEHETALAAQAPSGCSKRLLRSDDVGRDYVKRGSAAR